MSSLAHSPPQVSARPFTAAAAAAAEPNSSHGRIRRRAATHARLHHRVRAELKLVLFEGWMANDIAAGGQLTTITAVDFSARPFHVASDSTTVLADAVIVATGAVARRLHFARSDAYWNRGISACDGAAPIFRSSVSNAPAATNRGM